MNCCGCGKLFDPNKSILDGNGNPLWYGKYKAGTCIKIICSECIKNPNKKALYKD